MVQHVWKAESKFHENKNLPIGVPDSDLICTKIIMNLNPWHLAHSRFKPNLLKAVAKFTGQNMGPINV